MAGLIEKLFHSESYMLGSYFSSFLESNEENHSDAACGTTFGMIRPTEKNRKRQRVQILSDCLNKCTHAFSGKGACSATKFSHTPDLGFF